MDCDDTTIAGTLVGWIVSSQEMTSEEQDFCTLKRFEKARPLNITSNMIGDIPISLVKLYADGRGIAYDDKYKTDSVICIEKSESTIGGFNCIAELEGNLQKHIRGIIKTILKKLPNGHWMNDDTEALKNWYLSVTGSDSSKARSCVIETRDSWGGTINSEDMAGCFVKYEAQQILWLLDNFKEELQ